MAYRDVRLKADPVLYQATLSENVFSLRQARAEYSRIMKIVNKRLKRLGKSKYNDSTMYHRYKDMFKPLSRDASEKEVRKALADVAEAAQKKTLSIEGIKEAAANYAESMQELGYDFVTKKNARQLGELFRQANDYYGSKKAFDSEKVLSAFEDMFSKSGKPSKDYVQHTFEEWLERNN